MSVTLVVRPILDVLTNAEHFVHQASVSDGYYRIPDEPGFSIELLESSIQTYKYPDGKYWASEEGKEHRDLIEREL
jgi:hypothetical protein